MLKNTQVIKPMMIACSAGLLLTACSTHKEAEYSSTTEGYTTGTTTSVQEGSGSESSSSQSWDDGQASRSYSQSSQMSGDQVVIPLHEERLNVGKRTVDAGTVTIRKVVTTETVNQPIELRRETLVIDREGAGAQRSAQFQSSTSSQRETSGAGASVNAGTEQSGAGVSAQAGVGDSSAGISAGAGQSGAGVSAGATTGDTADAQATAGAESESDKAANAQADFDQSEAAGAERSADQSSARQSTSRQSTSSQSYSSGSQNSSSGATSGAPFQEQTYTIQLREEQPVVEKSVVQTGQVTARKNAEMERQTVQREVRREDVRVDQGNNSRVQMRGDFNSGAGINEPSGASTEGQSRTYQSESEITTEHSGAAKSGIYDKEDAYEDRNTLDDINRGSNTRGGAEDLQNFDERSTPRE